MCFSEGKDESENHNEDMTGDLISMGTNNHNNSIFT